MSLAVLASREVDDDADDVADDDAVVEDVADDADDADVDDVEDDAITDDPDDAVVDDDDDVVADETVEVVLTEYEIDMETTLEAGIIAFEVTNEGEFLHGIAIEEGAPAANDDDDENEENEENGGELISAVTVDPGDSETIEVELEEGEYTLYCPMGEHRDEERMELELTVE